MGNESTDPTSFKKECELYREHIKGIADAIYLLKSAIQKEPALGATEKANPSEMIANVTIAYRALEDASMRLGKAIQAFDGGVSVYDKSKVVGA